MGVLSTQSTNGVDGPGLFRSRSELRLANPSTGGRSGSCDKYLESAVLKVVLLEMVEILRGKQFHRRGPTTANDDS